MSLVNLDDDYGGPMARRPQTDPNAAAGGGMSGPLPPTMPTASPSGPIGGPTNPYPRDFLDEGPRMPRARAGPVGAQPAPSSPQMPDMRTGIANAYQTYLGRGINPWEYQFWLNDPNYASGIANSPEAQAHAAGRAYVPHYDPAAGWDYGKLNDPGKSNTKYNFGRAAQEFGGVTRGNLQPLVDYFNQKYGGRARVVGPDLIDFGEGYGPVDVINGQTNGLQWLVPGLAPTAAPTGTPPTGQTPASPSGPSPTTFAQMSQPYGDAGDQIVRAYQTLLGRNPTVAEIGSQLGNGRAVSPQNVSYAIHNIGNSPEAQQYAASQRGQGSGSPPPVTTQPATQTPSGSGIFTDPAAAQWEAQLRQLNDRLNQPVANPDYQPYVDYLRKYFQQLQQPAYSPQQMDLLQTQAIDPLTRQRDAARQQTLERLASRGINPSSGIAQKALSDLDRQYEQMATQQRSGFAENAITMNRQQAQQAAGVGNALNQLETARTATDEQRALQALQLIFEVPQYADQRLALAHNTLQPLNPAGLFSNGAQYGQLGLQQYGINQDFWSQLAHAVAHALGYE